MYLSFKSSSAWFVSVIVVGCHRAIEYHTTLCLGSGSMIVTILALSHKRCQLMMPKIISELHGLHVL